MLHKKMMHGLLFCLFMLALFSIKAPINSQAEAIEELVYRHSWGDESYHTLPYDVVVSADNQWIYTSQPEYHRVLRINRMDRSFDVFGKFGKGEGYIYSPYGIALDQKGNLYIADPKSFSVQEFTSEGVYKRTLSRGGTCGYYKPYWVEVGLSDEIYVKATLNGNQRILKFNQDGICEKIFDYSFADSSVSDGTNNIEGAAMLTVDGNGNIYSADRYKIIKFSPDGSQLSSWDLTGNIHCTAACFIKGIDVDDEGNVYTTHLSYYRIQKYSPDGKLIKTIGEQGSTNGKIMYPMGIYVDTSGSLYIADYGNQRLQKLDKNGNYLFQWGGDEGKQEILKQPHGITSDSYGNVYVADTMNNRINKYNPDGVFLKTWGVFGKDTSVTSPDLQFDRPFAVIADQNNDILYVSDAYNYRIVKFSLDGAYIGSLGGPAEIGLVYGLALDQEGNLYLTENRGKVKKYSPTGVLLNEVDQQGTNPGQLNNPTAIGVDNLNEKVYILDVGPEQARIQVFDLSLQYHSYFNVVGSWGLAVDNEGNIWVSNEGEAFANQDLPPIRKYDPNGNLLLNFSVVGNEEGELFQPKSIAFNAQGNLLVADKGNNRIVEYAILPTPDPTSGLILNGGFSELPGLNNWTYGGSLPALLTAYSSTDDKQLQIGQPVAQSAQGESVGWAYQTIYINPAFEHPLLSFNYKLFVNDLIDYSAFFVEIQDGSGHDHITTILKAGYQPDQPGVPPSAGTELGSKSVSYDLTPYRGKYIRVVFSSRNLWPGSWGIWAQVDDVKISNSEIQKIFLPSVIR